MFQFFQTNLWRIIYVVIFIPLSLTTKNIKNDFYIFYFTFLPFSPLSSSTIYLFASPLCLASLSLSLLVFLTMSFACMFFGLGFLSSSHQFFQQFDICFVFFSHHCLFPTKQCIFIEIKVFVLVPV